MLVGLQKGTPPVDFRSFSLRELEMIGMNAHVAGTDMPEALRLLAEREESWRDTAPRMLALEQLVAEGLVPLSEGRSPHIKTLIDPRAAESRDSRM